jgi:RNA polymerase sigma factor (sigma-70 family)
MEGFGVLKRTEMPAAPQESRLHGKYAPSDALLLQLCRQGSEWAAATIHGRYEKRIRRLAQRHWPPAMRSRFDPEDIVQEVFDRFFRAIRRGLYSGSEVSGLWGFFLVVTLNQIRKAASRHLSRRRDVRQTVGQGSMCCHLDLVPHEMPSAHSRMVVEELLTALAPFMREVVERKLQGYTVREIADDLLVSRRAVERVLQEVRRRFAEFFERSPDWTTEGPLRPSQGMEKPLRREPIRKVYRGPAEIRIA